jgi:hypothetical protein
MMVLDKGNPNLLGCAAGDLARQQTPFATTIPASQSSTRLSLYDTPSHACLVPPHLSISRFRQNMSSFDTYP